MNKMKRSWDKDWIPINKDEMNLLFGILLLQGIVQEPNGCLFLLKQTFGNAYYLRKYVRKRFFILLKFFNFTVNEAHHGQVPPKIYKMKPVFDPLIKFSESNVPEDQISIDESLLF
jgi:hypothetical protein